MITLFLTLLLQLGFTGSEPQFQNLSTEQQQQIITEDFVNI